ncbi:hypothetical protein H072_5926 [Dactylellina haptotyla CBS 200.50]|uniref:Uncharacterized protein n=1 Tax=Dactylellina haptotyla (strain CBS 200.50) TaxID=1284197 RepID=S8ABE0_DACHA|nr:hypothetical protein H072_5926 [Dactylellina haptotyla CBS 200.50]
MTDPEEVVWYSFHDEEILPWQYFAEASYLRLYPSFCIIEIWAAIEAPIQIKKVQIAQEWKELSDRSKAEYISKANDPENWEPFADQLVFDSNDYFRWYTVHRTYFGEPDDPESQNLADLAWKNLFYLLHFNPEEDTCFDKVRDLNIPSYADKSVIGDIINTQQIAQRRIVDKLDYSSMGFTLKGEMRVYGTYIIVADKDILIGGSGILKYVGLAGEDGREVERTTGPLLFANWWWKPLYSFGESIKNLQDSFGFDPDNIEANDRFRINLTNPSEEVLIDFLRRAELRGNKAAGGSFPEYTIDQAREIAKRAIMTIDNLYY